jgi:hypothetical protein
MLMFEIIGVAFAVLFFLPLMAGDAQPRRATR